MSDARAMGETDCSTPHDAPEIAPRRGECLTAIALATLAILPFLIAFCFIHPSYDDAGYLLETKARGLLGSQVFWYRTFSGRFVSNLIIGVLSLSIHHVWVYRLLCVAIFLVLLLSVHRLLSVALDLTRLEGASLAGLAVGTFLVITPSAAQGFYWLTGAATYTLGTAFLFFAIAGVLAPPTRGVTWRTLTWIVLAVGMNEVALLLLVGFLTLVSARDLVEARGVSRRRLIWLTTCAAASFASLGAPGNRRRLEFSHDVIRTARDLPTALVSALKELVRDTYYVVHVSPLLFALVAALLLVGGVRQPPRWAHWRRELLALPGFVLVLYGVLAFFIYAQGVRPIPRVMNAVYLPMIVLAIVVVVRLARLGERPYFRPAILSAIALLGFVDVAMRAGSGVRGAWGELARGQWSDYDREVRARATYLRGRAGQNVVVPEIASRPATIFVFDISPDPTQRHNVLYAWFYGVRSIAATPRP